MDLAVHEADPVTFYVASATGGVFKTTDNGVTLVPVFEHEGTHSVGAIALHQRDTSVVWVGTGERANRQSSSWGDGVYRSTDGGASWTNMGLRESRHIGRIALHPDDPDLVYVAAMGHLWGPNDERGLYRSADGGETWQPILQVDENTGVVDVALDPARPRHRLRRHLPAPAPSLGLPRRRPRQRASTGAPTAATAGTASPGPASPAAFPRGSWDGSASPIYRERPPDRLRERRAGLPLQRVHRLHRAARRASTAPRTAARRGST